MNFEIDTDAMFQKLLKKMAEFDATHEKGEIPGRKDLLEYLILRFRIESPEEDIITIERSSDSITVKILSDQILYIDEVPTFKQLIQLSSSFEISSDNGKVLFKLTFHLWEWKKKDQA